MKSMFFFYEGIFNNTEKTEIIKFLDAGKDKVSLWKIYSIFGNLIPILIAILLNLYLNGQFKYLNYLTTGALPLVSYGIITSSVLYLLDATIPSHEILRKKILGIAIIFLFLNITLFVLSTIVNSNEEKGYNLWVLLLLSLLLFIYSYKISKIILVMQKEIAGYSQSLSDSRENVKPDPNKTKDEGVEYD